MLAALTGLKTNLGVEFEEAWRHLHFDLLSNSNGDDCGQCETVDGCCEHIADQCNLLLDVKTDVAVVMSSFAHICPHVLQPSWPTTTIFMACSRMKDVIGQHASRISRSKLVRYCLRMPGEIPGPSNADLYQDPYAVRDSMVCTFFDFYGFVFLRGGG